jgi:TP901 family phage tail tape measure protein
MRSVGAEATAAGRSMFRGLTLPVLGVAAASVKLSLDFEKSMTNIRALVGASDKQMESYRDGVLELGKVVPQGPQELADALYFITSSGFKGASALSVLEASAKAAAAGLGDTAGVADLVTSAVNVYGESNLKASAATDTLLATVREGKAEPAELAAAFGRVLAPAEAMGVSFQEAGGAVAGLTLGGLDAAEAVTGLRGILSGLIKPTDQARDVLEQAGTSVDTIRKNVATKGLLPTLQSLRDRFGDNKDALGDLFPNVRALNAFLSLTGRNARKNADAMKEVTGATGDTNKAFGEASEDASFRLRRAWSQIRVELIEAGAVIVPIVAGLADNVGKVLDYFNQLSPSTKKLVVGIVGVLAALGPMVLLFGALATAVGVILSPIGLIIIAIAALAIGFVVLYTKSETFRRIVGEAWIYVQAIIARFVAWFKGTALPAIQNVVTFLRALWARFGGTFLAIGRQFLSTLVGIFRAYFQIVKSVVEFFLAILRGDWSAAWNALKGIVRGVFQLVIAIIKGFYGNIKAVVSGIGGILLGLVGDFLGWGKDLGLAIIHGIIDAISGAAGSIGSALLDALPDPGGGVPFIPGIATGVRNFGGGLAMVGERGPELVNLPPGSDVYNARQTRRMMGAPAGDTLTGMRIAGTLDLDTGQLEGVVLGTIGISDRRKSRRERMGAR